MAGEHDRERRREKLRCCWQRFFCGICLCFRELHGCLLHAPDVQYLVVGLSRPALCKVTPRRRDLGDSEIQRLSLVVSLLLGSLQSLGRSVQGGSHQLLCNPWQYLVFAVVGGVIDCLIFAQHTASTLVAVSGQVSECSHRCRSSGMRGSFTALYWGRSKLE